MGNSYIPCKVDIMVAQRRHPHKCGKCEEYSYIEFNGVRAEDKAENKGFGLILPFFVCHSCGWQQCMAPKKQVKDFENEIMKSIKPGEFFEIPLKYVFSKMDEERTFKYYDHLGFRYDPRDYYLIPGLLRPEDDGYLTPVFFDKDVLLYYNSHPDYTVVLGSFSSGNIHYKGERMFSWGFGINRSGKLFKWLGDLNNDFKDEEMKGHLKRWQASNVDSDHDVISKFYFSQNPFSIDDAFQDSDNELRLFRLKNDFNNQFRIQHGIDLIKLDIDWLTQQYRPPVIDDRHSIFNTYIHLNKYFIENLDAKVLKSVIPGDKIVVLEKKAGRSLGSLKLLAIYLGDVLDIDHSDQVVSPLFVLNDLRQLQGHLADDSFDKKYSYCKERLKLPVDCSDFEVYQSLVSHLLVLFTSIVVPEGKT